MGSFGKVAARPPVAGEAASPGARDYLHVLLSGICRPREAGLRGPFSWDHMPVNDCASSSNNTFASLGSVSNASDAKSSSDLAGRQTRHARDVTWPSTTGLGGVVAVQSARVSRAWWVPATRCCDLNDGPGSGPGPGSTPDVGQFSKV